MSRVIEVPRTEQSGLSATAKSILIVLSARHVFSENGIGATGRAHPDRETMALTDAAKTILGPVFNLLSVYFSCSSCCTGAVAASALFDRYRDAGVPVGAVAKDRLIGKEIAA